MPTIREVKTELRHREWAEQIQECQSSGMTVTAWRKTASLLTCGRLKKTSGRSRVSAIGASKRSWLYLKSIWAFERKRKPSLRYEGFL